VDAGFDQNKAELGILVLAVALKVFPNSDGLIVRVRYTGRGAELQLPEGSYLTFLINM